MGSGPVAVEVPSGWATNALRCATPRVAGVDHEEKRYLTDEQIRGNPTVTVRVGDRLRAYAKGMLDLAGAVEGSSVRPDREASHPPAWRATQPGRSTITLTVPGEDGGPAVIGVVTVVVR